jgi:hypothetical protein
MLKSRQTAKRRISIALSGVSICTCGEFCTRTEKYKYNTGSIVKNDNSYGADLFLFFAIYGLRGEYAKLTKPHHFTAYRRRPAMK